MNLLKKFYDTGMDVAGSGNDTQVLESPAPVNIASLMASQGVRTTEDRMVEIPPINTENKEEPTTAEKNETVETTTTTSNAEQANSESQAIIETAKAEEQQIAETVIPAPTWQEVLRSQQPDTVLKELGFDDKQVGFVKDLKELDPKILAFIDVYKTKGIEGIKPYVKEWTTDYAKMSPEEVMRHQLQEEYPKANPTTINALYKKKIVEAYNLDSEDTVEAEEGAMLLEAEADRYRDKLIAMQQEKLFPNPPEAKAPEPDKQAEQQQQEFEAYKSIVSKDPYAQSVFNSRKITIGKGDKPFNYPVDPDVIKNVLYDTEKWRETQFDKSIKSDGSFQYTPKVQNQILTAAFVMNPQKFLDEYAQHYLSIGGQRAIEPIDNAKPPENVTVSNAVATPTNAAEAMAKGGVRVSGAS